MADRPLLDTASGDNDTSQPNYQTVRTPEPPGSPLALNPHHQDIDTTKLRFAFGRLCTMSGSVLLLVICISLIVGAAGQAIFLTTFISTLEPSTGPYFVLTTAGLSFTVLFSLAAIFMYWQGGLHLEDVTMLLGNYQFHLRMALVGIFDAMNGVLIVFSAGGGRTPPALQSILPNFSIPFTLFFSRVILGTRYGTRDSIGAAIVMIGVIVSLVPLFHRLQTGEEKTQTTEFYWPLLFMLGVIPGVVMNVIQQNLQEKYRGAHNRRVSVTVFQAVESFYQSLSFLALFWLNIIPGFGDYKTLHEWSTSMGDGFKCFFEADTDIHSRCQYSGIVGTGFILSYMLVYVCGTVMTEHASANLSAMVSAAATITPTVFWFAWPSANAWVGGSPYQTIDLVFTIISLPLITVGSFIYHTTRRSSEKLTAMRVHPPAATSKLTPPLSHLHKALDSDDEDVPAVQLCWP